MKTISKRELNQQTAQVLAGIHSGQSVLVTERGVARWRIEAIEVAADPIARLRAEGRIVPALADPPPWPKRNHRRRGPADVDTLYRNMREDR